MATVTANGVTITYDEFGFVFNPYNLIISSDTRCTIRAVVSLAASDNIVVERDTVINNSVQNSVNIDVSACLKLAYNTDELWKVEMVDTVLFKRTDVLLYKRLPGSTENLYITTITIKNTWGALQIGQQYRQRDRYIMWPGLPFTVPLLFMDDSTQLYWYQRSDGGVYTEKGVLSGGKYNININLEGAQEKVVIRLDPKQIQDWGGIYTKEFDHTFREYDRLRTGFIEIDIAPCERPDSVYLRWIGPLGEWYYFLFDKVTTSKVTTDLSPIIEPYYLSVNDFSDMDHPGTGSPIGKTGQENIQVTGPLIESEIYDYVFTLATSPIVYMMIDGGAWVRVNIVPGTFTRNKDILQDISFTINKPRDILQTL